MPQTEYREGEHDIPMLESCLTFLATLVSTRTNLGKTIIFFFNLFFVRSIFFCNKVKGLKFNKRNQKCLGLSDPEMSRLEMVTLLCMSDKTHSQLMELMPERCGTTQNRDFESVLAEVI